MTRLPILEDGAAPATFLWVFRQIDFVFVAIDVENMKLSFPFVGHFGYGDDPYLYRSKSKRRFFIAWFNLLLT